MLADAIRDAIEGSLGEQTQAWVNSPDEVHFSALVVSPKFETLSLVKQHQLVMLTLKEAFDSETVHALELKTFTPQKWAEVKNQFPQAKGA